MRSKLKFIDAFDENDYKNIIKECRKRFKYISRGSSRMVFRYSNTLVLKVAYNDKGIAQNSAEIDLFRFTNEEKKILAPIIDYDNCYTWVLQRRVVKRLNEWGTEAEKFMDSNKKPLKSLEVNYGLLHGDTQRSLGKIGNKIVLYDYGYTEYVKKQYY